MLNTYTFNRAKLPTTKYKNNPAAIFVKTQQNIKKINRLKFDQQCTNIWPLYIVNTVSWSNYHKQHTNHYSPQSLASNPMNATQPYQTTKLENWKRNVNRNLRQSPTVWRQFSASK